MTQVQIWTMLLRILTILSIASAAWGEEGFRISKVVPEGTPGSARFEMAPKKDQEPEVIFVENDPIVTSEDVESAGVDPVSEGAISIKLRDGGEKKIGAATANPSGNLRLAVIVDGRALMAAVVRGTLGKNFQISGLQDLSEDELWSYALTIEGKSADEVKAGVEEMRQNREKIARMPREEPEYHTDEEYALLKAAREKAGIHFSDEIPTQESLDRTLRKGMTEEEVIDVYGKPRWRKKNADGGTSSFRYELADEKRPIERKLVRQDFVVNFENGKVTDWKQSSWGDRTRTAKGKEPASQRMIYPPYDPSDPDLDVLTFFEGTRISGDRIKLSLTEAADLLGNLYMLSRPDVASREIISSDCDGMVFMAANFPEVKELVETSPGRKVSLAKLHEILDPYVMGKKEYPDHLLKAPK